MTVIRALVALHSESGLPEDDAMNVWHFGTNQSNIADMVDDVDTKLTTFYDAIGAIYSANTLDGNMTVKYYDLEDAPPRTPVTTNTHVLAGLGDADALPTECAIVLSYHAGGLSGANPRRRRGRLYLGPLDSGTSSTASGLVTVGGGIRTLIVGAADDLLAANDILGTFWIVFSPTNAGAEPWSSGDLTAGSSVTVGGYVDDAFDTQRRRGTAATTRTTFGS